MFEKRQISQFDSDIYIYIHTTDQIYSLFSMVFWKNILDFLLKNLFPSDTQESNHNTKQLKSNQPENDPKQQQNNIALLRPNPKLESGQVRVKFH